MSKFLIRYNKTRGLPGRGTSDHAWRVFENGKEYLFKNYQLNVPSRSEQTGGDWNVACEGVLVIDKETSTAIINPGVEN
jgi:hypothetical protein